MNLSDCSTVVRTPLWSLYIHLYLPSYKDRNMIILHYKRIFMNTSMILSKEIHRIAAESEEQN